ncbi:HIR complex subunit [Tilletia horrida]|uniref:Protein HIR n=1 Tax=Tilletia horrida TaxID=155126 RepID=A0AAN6JU13_9BASI|nr:HIR complex subunit [Tilletia horrida]
MSVVLPDWVAHFEAERKKRQTIFSVHAHPDGTRIATGGLDSKVCIWATGPLLDESLDNPKTDKLLSTLARHSGSVLVVRWSQSGKFLASGSDDTIALVWELDPAGAGALAFGSATENVETYRCVRRLSGHESDVADLAWSPHDEFLATVGLDSTIFVYSGYTFDRVRKLDGHQGFVKGVVWDSVGHFLATASDDKTVKVWRVSDWQLEAEVKAPFTNSPNSLFFRRPSWSPDGAHLLTANAMNGPVFVASVITRGTWSSDVSLVGHENAVSITAFNPRLFRGAESPTSVATVLALGSIDQSVSVWVTGHPRPVLVFREVFDRQVTDLSSDGLVLYASSADGSLAVFQFTHDQLPNFATEAELENARNVFGFRRPQPISAHNMHASRAISATPSRPSPSQITLLPNGQPARLKQEITIKNGKRRIRPTQISEVPGDSYTGPSSAQPAALPSTSMAVGMPAIEFGGVKRKAEDEIDLISGRVLKAPVMKSSSREVGETLGAHAQRDIISAQNRTSFINVPSAFTRTPASAAAGGMALNLPLPRVAAFSRIEYGGCLLDVRNFDGTGSSEYLALFLNSTGLNQCPILLPSGPAEVAQIELPIDGTQEKVLWIDFHPVPIVAATITPRFSAVVTADRMLITYGASGRRIANVKLEALPFLMRSVGRYLMIINTRGDILRWDAIARRQLDPTLSLSTILDSPAGYNRDPGLLLLDGFIYTNGLPILVMASEKVYTIDARTGCFVCIADSWWAEHSPYWDRSYRARLSGSLSNPSATLWTEPMKAIEAEINSLVASRSATRFPPPPSGVQRSGMEDAVAIRHLETRMQACDLLGSAQEYKANLLLLAKRLSDEGIRNMAEELIKILYGPVH